MKTLLTGILLFTLTLFTQAQSGSVSGTITDNTNVSLFGANLMIKNTTIGMQTNENGNFTITPLQDGNYVLVVSSLGYKTREINFSITNNQAVNLETVVLYEGNEILSEVIVEGNRVNKFSRKRRLTCLNYL